MESEELKETQAALDVRLKENDRTEETVTPETARSKVNRLFLELKIREILNLVGCIIVIPIGWSFLERSENKLMLIALIYTIVFFTGCIIWHSYKIRGLKKFDLAKSVSDNIYCINRYNLQIKREKTIGTIAASILIIPLFLRYVETESISLLWGLTSCTVILSALATYWFYKKIYDKNISSVLKSLDELKALKEKEE
ncbi:MAG: hypothetical protein LBK65_07000 [Tannerellaceae bacterium]|jgi:hypothetical protein|nr:hypothetical protein [Tannerellaceae bacterium]